LKSLVFFIPVLKPDIPHTSAYYMLTLCLFADSNIRKKHRNCSIPIAPKMDVSILQSNSQPLRVKLSSERVQFWNTKIEHTNITWSWTHDQCTELISSPDYKTLTTHCKPEYLSIFQNTKIREH
jgi:hypothetical protein